MKLFFAALDFETGLFPTFKIYNFSTEELMNSGNVSEFLNTGIYYVDVDLSDEIDYIVIVEQGNWKSFKYIPKIG